MTELLLDWLNTELKLSKSISNIPNDFANGYLFGELLHRTKISPNFKLYKNTNNEKDIIHNFCLLEQSLRNINIILTTKGRDDIISKTKHGAELYLFKIRQQLDKRLINYDTLRFKHSQVIQDIYRKLRFGDNEPYIRAYKIRQEGKQKAKDKFGELKEKFKNLKLNQRDYEMIQESQKDLEIYDEIRKDIKGIEGDRHKKLTSIDNANLKGWMKQMDESRKFKIALQKEKDDYIDYYRQGSLNYLAQSADMGKQVVKRFESNLSRMGLDIPMDENLKKKNVNISTDIIMLRMREELKKRMIAKKEKDKRERRKIREELEMMKRGTEHVDKMVLRKKIPPPQIMQSSHSKTKETNQSQSGELKEENEKVEEENKDEIKEGLKEEQKKTVENNRYNTSLNDEHEPYIIHTDENIVYDEKRMDLIKNSFQVHKINKIGDRVQFFQTILKDEVGEKEESEKEKELATMEEFFKELDKQNVNFNIQQTEKKKKKKQKNTALIKPILNQILDIVDEVEKYQNEFNLDLISDKKWDIWVERFINNEPILSVVESIKEPQSEPEDQEIYDPEKMEITDRELDEIFNYSFFISDWNALSIIPDEWRGKVLKYYDIYKDFYKPEETGFPIEEYEPTTEELENLTMPIEYLLNPTFGDIIKTAIEKEFGALSQETVEEKVGEAEELEHSEGEKSHHEEESKNKEEEHVNEEQKEKDKEESHKEEHQQPNEENQEKKEIEEQKEIVEANKEIEEANKNEEVNQNEEVKNETEEELPLNTFDYLPIKMSIIGYPLSGKKTQSNLLLTQFQKLKFYDLIKIMNEKIEQYNKLQEPIESHPKFKTFKQKQIDEWNTEHEKQVELFEPVLRIIQPYLDIPENERTPDKISDNILLKLLVNQLSIDFPLESKEAISTELNEKYAKKKELIAHIEELKKEEEETKKPKTKDIQIAEKEIEKLNHDLYVGFIVINFPNTVTQSTLIEHFFTGYVNDVDKPINERTKMLFSYSNLIDFSLNKTKDESTNKSWFDGVINLSLPKEEIKRRFDGLRYDPVTKIIYHMEDNPPKVSDKKVLERLSEEIPNLSRTTFEKEIEQYENNIVPISNFYKNMNENNCPFLNLKIEPKETKEEINLKIVEQYLTLIITRFFEGEIVQESPLEHLTEQKEQSKDNVKDSSGRESQGKEGSKEIVPNENSSLVQRDVSTPVDKSNQKESSSVIERTITNQSLKKGLKSKERPDTASSIHSIRGGNWKVLIEPNWKKIYLEWVSFASKYDGILSKFFYFMFTQRIQIIRVLNKVQRRFIRFLNRKSGIRDMCVAYITKYNNLLVNHPEAKNNPIVAEELGKDIVDLSEKMWIVIQDKKEETVRHYEEIVKNSILLKELERLFRGAKPFFLIEVKKYYSTIEIIKDYYTKNTVQYDQGECEKIFDGIPEDAPFHEKIETLFKNCLKFIIIQDNKVKNFIQNLPKGNSNQNTYTVNSANTNESFLKKSKKRLLASQNNLNANISALEEEIKSQVKIEKEKFKFRLMSLKFRILKNYEIVEKLFNDTYQKMDNWIIESVTHQNNTLNEFIYYLKSGLKRFVNILSLSDFYFDSYDIFHPIDPEIYFKEPEKKIDEEKDFLYNVSDLVSLYHLLKQYKMSIPYLVPYNIVKEILVKKYFTNAVKNTSICSYIKTLSYTEYREFLNIFIEEVDHVNNNEDNEHEHENEHENESIKKTNYDTFININKLFTVLFLLGSEISDTTYENMKVTKEEYLKMNLWFEEDVYINEYKDENEESVLNEKGKTKIQLVKEALYEINKDQDSDMIDLNKLVNIFKETKKFNFEEEEEEEKTEDKNEFNIEKKEDKEEFSRNEIEVEGEEHNYYNKKEAPIGLKFSSQIKKERNLKFYEKVFKIGYNYN